MGVSQRPGIRDRIQRDVQFRHVDANYAKGELKLNEKITIESIVGSTMSVEVVELTKYGPYDAVIPEVSGTASITGKNEFYFDPDDSFCTGFIMR